MSKNRANLRLRFRGPLWGLRGCTPTMAAELAAVDSVRGLESAAAGPRGTVEEGVKYDQTRVDMTQQRLAMDLIVATCAELQEPTDPDAPQWRIYRSCGEVKLFGNPRLRAAQNGGGR